ncbi:cysteine hydrolase family protein [Desulfonatronum sp. SC1]|uniref:cysteine hydrolase family protein n=1 Tax=Desulfonatronum sp. SC1 TaxID=2109626 RepID=UPI000D2F599E|nr:isochorismatase family cysteine hydrolase [Desulfonatronum sp. SC1]PTN35326.1 cysteine hydrolase [Desulfonatronum sp. SC1]
MSGFFSPALLIVDMQNDFVLPDALAAVAGARETIPVIAALAEHARKRSWPVIHVVREHRPDGSDVEYTRQELFQNGVGICVAGTPGARIVAELMPRSGDYVLTKQRFSAFLGTELDLLLRRLRAETLIVAGTQYPNCIRATAMDALGRDYRVIVATDACSAQTERIAANNIEDMRNMGMMCIPFQELINLSEEKLL